MHVREPARTPINTIRGNAELVGQGSVHTPAEVAATIERIEAESIRTGRLVDDLLALARLDETAQLRLQQVDLLAVVAEAVADARVRASERAVRIQHLVASPWSDLPPVVQGEETLLRQVLTNLLGNALRHTPGRHRGRGRPRRPRRPGGGQRRRPRAGARPGERGTGLRAVLPGGGRTQPNPRRRLGLDLPSPPRRLRGTVAPCATSRPPVVAPPSS
ncbi:MAG: HAMP domain-containing histidine kinase [Propionibacteriaceae bacterium]|nr:HAMP domain-containing histidine kinase [Propionibacteriaceae bacterium]